METETGERGPSSPSPYSLAPTVKRRVFDWMFKAPWLVIAVSVVVFALLRLLSVDLPVTVRYLPLVLSVVFLGLPHGAVDYLVPARALGERVTLRWLGVVGVVYLMFGGVYTVAWYVLPFASAVFFVLMTWFHWGQGEIYPLVYVAEAEYVDDALQRYLVLAVRGGLPMAAPLVFFPEIYRRVIESFVSVFVSRPDVSYLVTTRMRVLVGALLATLTVASALRAYLSDSNSDAWRLEVGETGLLWLYFAVVPPVFAVGVYFCVWHSTRHIARVVLLDSESRKGLETGVTPALGKFAKEAAPLTVLSLVFLAGFYVAVPNPPALRMGALPDLIALYLVFVSVLTLPHVAITTWLDRKQLT